MVAGAQYSIQAGENEQRIDFLKQFGWEVEQEPVSIEEIVIPQQFNQVYERYNELQKTQGMDLTKYAGKTVKKVVGISPLDCCEASSISDAIIEPDN